MAPLGLLDDILYAVCAYLVVGARSKEQGVILLLRAFLPMAYVHSPSPITYHLPAR